MRTLTSCFFLALLAQADDAHRLAGSWTGDSLCNGNLPSCKNEKVVYVFREIDSAGRVDGYADKIVDGNRVKMGDFEMKYDAKSSTLTWENPVGLWKYSIKENEIEGTMTLKSGEVVRHVHVRKDKP